MRLAGRHRKRVTKFEPQREQEPERKRQPQREPEPEPQRDGNTINNVFGKSVLYFKLT